MTIGLESTTSTFTEPLAFCWLAMEGVTADREIFSIIADFASPVPAAFAPAFWTKNISSFSGYLGQSGQQPSTGQVTPFRHGSIPDSCFMEYRIRIGVIEQRQG